MAHPIPSFLREKNFDFFNGILCDELSHIQSEHNSLTLRLGEEKIQQIVKRVIVQSLVPRLIESDELRKTIPTTSLPLSATKWLEEHQSVRHREEGAVPDPDSTRAHERSLLEEELVLRVVLASSFIATQLPFSDPMPAPLDFHAAVRLLSSQPIQEALDEEFFVGHAPVDPIRMNEELDSCLLEMLRKRFRALHASSSGGLASPPK